MVSRVAVHVSDESITRARRIASNVRAGTGSEHNAWRAALTDFAEWRTSKDARLASVAGDLWNELENLREHWEGTERESFIQTYIDRYEQEAI